MVSEYWDFVRFVLCDLCQKKIYQVSDFFAHKIFEERAELLFLLKNMCRIHESMSGVCVQKTFSLMCGSEFLREKQAKQIKTSSRYCFWVSTTITHLTCPVSGLLPFLPELSVHLLQIPGISFRLVIQSAHGLPAMLLVCIHWVRCIITLQFICLKTG